MSGTDAQGCREIQTASWLATLRGFTQRQGKDAFLDVIQEIPSSDFYLSTKAHWIASGRDRHIHDWELLAATLLVSLLDPKPSVAQ